MGGDGAIVPRAWVYSHYLLHTLQAIKLEVGLGMRLQEEELWPRSKTKKRYFNGQIATSIVSCPDPLTHEPDCLPHEHYSITLKAVITKE